MYTRPDPEHSILRRVVHTTVLLATRRNRQPDYLFERGATRQNNDRHPSDRDADRHVRGAPSGSRAGRFGPQLAMKPARLTP